MKPLHGRINERRANEIIQFNPRRIRFKESIIVNMDMNNFYMDGYYGHRKERFIRFTR